MTQTTAVHRAVRSRPPVLAGDATVPGVQPDRLLTTGAVLQLLAVSRTTLWRLINADDPTRRVPAPLKVGSGNRWSERALLEWIAARADERTTA